MNKRLILLTSLLIIALFFISACSKEPVGKRTSVECPIDCRCDSQGNVIECEVPGEPEPTPKPTPERDS